MNTHLVQANVERDSIVVFTLSRQTAGKQCLCGGSSCEERHHVAKSDLPMVSHITEQRTPVLNQRAARQ